MEMQQQTSGLLGRFPRGAGNGEDFRCVVVVVVERAVVVGFDVETVDAVVVVAVGTMYYFRVRAILCRSVHTTKCDGDL